MTELKLFENKKFGNVRVIVLNNVEWLVAKDVVNCLGYEISTTSYSYYVNKFVDDEDKLNCDSQLSFGIDYKQLGQRGGYLINESGLYSLVLNSKLDSAKQFKRWVTSEVLPSIRKHGAYMTDNVVDAIYNDPQVMIDLLTKLKNEKEARVAAERKNAILTHVSKLYTATEIAKELGFKSAIALNKDLHDRKIQYQSNGTWVLYSQYSNMALTSIKQTVLDNGKVVYDRRWTQEGREFLLNLYDQEK